MHSNARRGAIVAAAAVSIVIVAGTGSAHAKDSADAIGGRERIKVTFTSDAGSPADCDVRIDGVVRPDSISAPAGDSASQVFAAEPGTRNVKVYCYGPGAGGSNPHFEENVTVAPADPMLDLVDQAMAGVGSSALVSDPTLLP